MDSSRKNVKARSRKPEPQPSYCKNVLTGIGYVLGSTIVALCIWPASAGDIVAKFKAPAVATFTSDLLNQIAKENRFTQISFQDRWSAVPASVTEPADKNSRHEPREGGVENIPFSCELAFSRLVRQGNFSTRCVASIDSSKPAA
jgi:hypothetical protein